MDFTLIICLLRCLKCFRLNKKFDWNTKPVSTDLTVEADIYRLKAYRNKICHLPTTTGIQPNDFVNWWNEIEQILVRRSSPALNIQQVIADFKACPLDLEEEKRLQEEVKRWKDYEADVDRLNEEMKKVQTDVAEVKKDVEAKFTGVEKDMKEVKAKFTGVEKDMKEVKERFTGVEEKLEAIEKRQDAERSNEGVSPIQTAEEIYQTRKKDNTREDIQNHGNIFQRFFGRIQYARMKRRLKNDLVKFYRKKHSGIPLSPLIEEIETPLVGFYVMPDMVSVIQKSLTSDEEEKHPVNSLTEFFTTESEGQKEIYLSADAGFGKTALSKYLAIRWCEAHCIDRDNESFKYADLKALLDFGFLFLVLLRECSAICHVDEMIERQIIKKLPNSNSASLKKILRREKCLIILDGLDEWTHPENSCPDIDEKIPHRYERDNCVILTTTRPWKLGFSNLKASQVSKKVELVELNAVSRAQLERNAIRKMIDHVNDYELEDYRRNFENEIAYHDLENMRAIPLLLLYTLCLWSNRIPIGNSKHETYRNIIEFLLSRTVKKHPKIKASSVPSDSDIPEYFRNLNFCKKFYTLLKALAELAYQTLFDCKRENTLVFDEKVVNNYLKTEDLTLSFFSGILTESRIKTLTEETSKVSFSHKTVQEYFAAIFICFQSDAHEFHLKNCISVQDVLDISKFICDMNAKVMCKLSHDLMSVVNNDEETRNYRTRTGGEKIDKNPLFKIQNVLLSCLKRVSESENLQLYIQDLFIDRSNKQDTQLQEVAKQNENNIKSVYVSTKNSSASFCEIIYIFSLTNIKFIQKAYFEGYKMKTTAIENSIFAPSCERNLGEIMTTFKDLQSLHIGKIAMCHEELKSILNFITSNKVLKQIELFELTCTKHYRSCERIIVDLSQHSHLTKLRLGFLPALQLNMTSPSLVDVNLWHINLGDSSLLSPDMLKIKSVSLGSIQMSVLSKNELTDVLENLPQPVEVNMKGFDLSYQSERL